MLPSAPGEYKSKQPNNHGWFNYFAKGARTAMSACFNSFTTIPRGQSCPRSCLYHSWPNNLERQGKRCLRAHAFLATHRDLGGR